MFAIPAILSIFALTAIPVPQDATLLFVTTPDCAACRQAEPLVQEIARMGYSVETVNAVQHPELVRDQLKVQAFPTFIMLSHDRIIDRVVGGGNSLTLKPRLLYMFERAAELSEKNNHNTLQTTPTTAVSTTVPKTNPPEISPYLTSSVKLRVDDPTGHSWGTGTIIDTRKGEALILTCGHIFRESKGDGNIEVHLFGQNSSVRVFGRCLYYDLEIDLALVTIVPPCPVQAVPIAPPQYQITANQQVLSVGCDGGANPSVREHLVMSTDRVGTPKNNSVQFHYIQVHGAPVGGRSGGGLFSKNGYLIGVCNTADPIQNDGQFVPPPMIRYVLQQRQLSEIYENPSLTDTSLTASATVSVPSPSTPQAIQAIPANPTATAAPVPMIPPSALVRQLEPLKIPLETQLRTDSQLIPLADADKPETQQLSPRQQATLDEIKRRQQDGDEVILIVRSRRNPDHPYDMIILDGSSDQFIDALAKRELVLGNPAPSYNPVIFSSHETLNSPTDSAMDPNWQSLPVVSQPQTATNRQPVSFPVLH
jgi:S1-C subfamily serine protease